MAHLPYVDLIPYTPSIIGQSTAGTATYSIQTGQSVIVGNLIFFTGSLSWTGHTGTGNMLIGNLPFTCRNIANFDPEFIVRTDSIAWPSANGYIFGELQTNQTFGQIVLCRSNATEQLVQMSAAGTVHFTGQYLR